MYKAKKESAGPNTPSTSDSPTQIDVCKTFTEKVTIAGLEELNSDRDCPVRFLFAVGLVLAIVLGTITSFRTIQEYLDDKPSLEIAFKNDGEILFPNITICTTALYNVSAAKNILIIPKEVEDKLAAQKAHRGKFIDETVQFFSMSLLSRNLNDTHLRFINDAWTATSEQFENPDEIFHQTMPSCSLTLFNCFYDGQPFDCCNAIVLGGNDRYICYGIPIASRFGNTSQTEKIFKKTDMKSVEFKVSAKMDWQWLPKNEDNFDGFLVIVGQPYTTMNDNPLAVAPGWHATVKLARIRRLNAVSECFPQLHLPKMAYMSYYDPNGKYCELDNFILPMHKAVQCTGPVANYFPNATLACNFRQLYACLQAGNGELDAFNFGNKTISISEELEKFLKGIGKIHEHCYPVCERWQYEPIIGYSELRNEKGLTTEVNKDVSWSQITVLIPSPYYEVYSYRAKSSKYVVVCNFGGASIMYLGLSMITFVQIFAYGMHSYCLLRKKRKLNKVQPQKIKSESKTETTI